MATQTISLHTFFECIPDHRINRNKKHPPSDIIILPILAVICGAESWALRTSRNSYSFAFLKSSNFSLPIFNNSSNNFTACKIVPTQVIRKRETVILFPLLQQVF